MYTLYNNALTPLGVIWTFLLKLANSLNFFSGSNFVCITYQRVLLRVRNTSSYLFSSLYSLLNDIWWQKDRRCLKWNTIEFLFSYHSLCCTRGNLGKFILRISAESDRQLIRESWIQRQGDYDRGWSNRFECCWYALFNFSDYIWNRNGLISSWKASQSRQKYRTSEEFPCEENADEIWFHTKLPIGTQYAYAELD